MRGDRVPIRSLDFRDFWVLDISRPSHSTREARGRARQAVRLHATPHALRTHRFVVAPRQSCNFSQSAAFDATHYCGVLAVTSTSMSIPGHASAVTTRNVPAGWVAPAYASARHLPASKK